MYGKGVAGAMALGMLVSAAGARAEGGVPEHPMMTDRFFLSIGAFYPESNTQGTLNSGTVGIGTFIDFENDFGLDERKLVGQLMFRMRLSQRWRLEVDYFKIDRNNSRELARTISFGDVNFPLSAEVRSSFNFQDARIGAGYSFFRSKDKEVGIGLGVHMTKFEASLETSTGATERASTSAPLPALTVYSQVALTDRWLLSMRLDRLSLDMDDTTGSVSTTGFDFVYQPWRNFNIGIGYRDVNMQISSTGDDWRGEAQIQQHGPLVFIGTTF